jgi:hypothetical protein
MSNMHHTMNKKPLPSESHFLAHASLLIAADLLRDDMIRLEMTAKIL